EEGTPQGAVISPLFGRCAIANRRTQGLGKPESFDFLGFTHYCATRRNVVGFDASARCANVRSCDAGMLRLPSRSLAPRNKPSSHAEPGGASGPASRSLHGVWP